MPPAVFRVRLVAQACFVVWIGFNNEHAGTLGKAEDGRFDHEYSAITCKDQHLVDMPVVAFVMQ